MGRVTKGFPTPTAPRLRHAFLTYNNWLFGQTWMTFFNVGALPENLDFVGPAESTIFGRQTQIRYTNGPWQFAAENPLTTITPYDGGGRIVADDSHLPDFVGRYNFKGDWGDFTVAAYYRQLRYKDNAVGMSDSTGVMASAFRVNSCLERMISAGWPAPVKALADTSA